MIIIKIYSINIWSVIDLSDGLSTEEQELIANARSFRVTLNDPEILDHPQSAMMGKNYQVHIRFNAELSDPDNADPGTTAWNSFGYRYTVPIGATGIDTSLNAEPLKVGVEIPAVPIINKDLKTPAGHYRNTEEAADYRFLIYSGAALHELDDISELSERDIADILSAAGRTFTVVTTNVEAGTSHGNTGYLDAEKIWEYDSLAETFAPTSNNWIWSTGARYSVMELPWAENGFSFSDTQHSAINNYTFTQNAENNVSIRVTNVWNETGNLSLEKQVTGSSYDANKSFTFTIHLQDGRYPVAGVFNYTGTNIRDGSLIFDDNGNAQIQLKHGQKIEIAALPAGYTYSITESEDDWYAMTSENASGVISQGETQDVQFTNTRKDVSLTLAKQVLGASGDNVKDFDFEIYISDEGRELNGTWQAVKTTASGNENISLNFSDGAAIVHLKDGEQIVINGLPIGARFETEELASSRAGYTYEANTESGVLSAANTSVVYRNTLITHDVTLSKTVTGNQGNKYKLFDFTVSIKNAEQNATYHITGDTEATLTTNASGSGSTTVSLRHGQTAVIENLPEGSVYQITEDATGYKVSYVITSTGTIESPTAQNASTAEETIDANDSIVFTNTKNGIIPTGIIYSPYGVGLLIVALAGLLSLVVAGKKKKKES